MAPRLSPMLFLRMHTEYALKRREMAADTVVLTVRIPVALQQQLDIVAQAMERSRTRMIMQALEHFVAVQAGKLKKSTRRLPGRCRELCHRRRT